VSPGSACELLRRSLGRGEEFAERSERIALFVLERLDDLPLDRYERTGDGPHAVSFPRRWRIARSGPSYS
jgi:hypothetical protein